jgi:hypothetical protein
MVDRSGVFQDAAIKRWAAGHRTQIVRRNAHAPGSKGTVERVFRSISSRTPPGRRN